MLSLLLIQFRTLFRQLFFSFASQMLKTMKKTRNGISVETKQKILAAVDEGTQKKGMIAKQFGIPFSTLSTIIKYRKNIEKPINETFHFNIKQRKRFRAAKHIELEESLFIWFKQARLANIPISGPIMIQKADELATDLNITDFHCSNGWLQRFKERRSVSFKSVAGESNAVDMTIVNEWKNECLPMLLEGYSPDNIYNADETGLFFNLLPDKTMHLKGENCAGGKRSKERITVLLCVNMSGTDKMKPFIIGKSAKPRCFKNVQSLPCDYAANKKAWMVTDIFEKWLLSMDRKLILEKRKAILFIDNCPSHPSDLQLKNLKVEFLPVNTTSCLQPLDQGIIQLTKVYYRKRLVQSLLRNMEKGTPLAKWNILDAIQNVCAAWNSVDAQHITNCFQKSGFKTIIDNLEFQENEPIEFIINNEWNELSSRMTIEGELTDFLNVDSEVLTTELLTNADIIAMVTHNVEENEPDDETLESTPPPKVSNALQAIEIVKHYIYSKEQVNESMFRSFHEVESFILNESFKSNIRQTSIMDFIEVDTV